MGKFCSFKRMIFIFEVLMVFFLFGSIVSPWYFSSLNITNELGAETDVWYLFYWPGYIINQQTAYPLDYPDNATKTDDRYDVVHWGSFNGEHAEIVYLSSNMLSLGAFLLAAIVVVVSFLVNFGHTKKESHARIQRVFIIVCSTCALVLNILSWGIFLDWPSALKDTTFCNNMDHEKAACTNFLGKKTFETGSNIYGPFLGWFFAVLATPTIMIAMIFACVAHSRNKKDSYENLSSPRANTYGHQSFESLSLN